MTITPRLKLLLGAVSILVSAILLGWLLYAIIFRPAPIINEGTVTDGTEDTNQGTLTLSDEAHDRQPTETTTETGGLPSSVANGGETFTQRLTSSGVESSILINGDSIAYFDPTDGRFYMINENGDVVMLSSAQFLGAETIVFADTADIVAIEFPDGTNILYNFVTENQVTLPSHWEDFEFSSTGEQVLSKVTSSDPNSNALIVTSSDGSQTNVIARLGQNADDVTVNWSPNNNVVGFSETGSAQSGFGRDQIYLIGADGEDAGALVVEGANFSAIWSPNGNNILYSVALASNDDKPSLWYTNATGSVGSERIRLSVETWVEKCTFNSSETIICAVPQEVMAGSGIDSRLIKSYDDVYEINLATGRASLLATTVLDLKMFNLAVSDDGTILYFSDQYDRLNYMNL
ncbi:hypothetical protein CO057_01845 [Candidatus Uhrbacteria bacterium CG_4_9_14_0_2_um_filter_41_50]|uniref:Dipeptidylpeptidase IV N-terminal domain-containing protein n=1 Tax=Candidatus Uhrbacteria bacterium CG_4_9_14_0_2_um_filter_41_50 TaxID=1975031 RepID=A0A2M8EPG3_9BACT|nr:MAG: hypothetical protein COZ45_01165 [Candidatus Uhrbacteria bacterium CG_4_10_14_3_um_filter_41_21]PIZ54874.1 MAG: hypothetical protein COY24_02280 [Candidatus Uhrbacteria bacterium CG_4_10_14_0_2_um_filter_41_21]PJB84712.1 MAG: hypothetical protein CO086_02165 [Candidatus Uhrbacteria bacterium CG_4_9_14_0_8_um_filter_41_16]PJC24628.1 MAG: hypothetical protein CO057_01845 [Candidatus Uhrbacteria bacterium CG_4_9_14_0_2_um_filter_41_50]PJE75400.1 MAG: hypothetical protein COV03_00335 [Candi